MRTPGSPDGALVTVSLVDVAASELTVVVATAAVVSVATSVVVIVASSWLDPTPVVVALEFAPAVVTLALRVEPSVDIVVTGGVMSPALVAVIDPTSPDVVPYV